MNLIKKGKVFTSIASAILIGALAVIPFITAKAADGDYQAVSIMVNTFSETTKQGLASVTYELYAAENIKDATGSIVIAKDTKLKSAVTNADGPGSDVTCIPASRHCFTSSSPGSDIAGVPASVTSAIFFPRSIMAISVSAFSYLYAHDNWSAESLCSDG